MVRMRAAFTLIEVAAAVVIVGLLLAVLIPMGSRCRNADGLSDSVHNLARIMAATHMYGMDNAGRAPMRACGYASGQVTGGWDTWNVGGKNCSMYWSGQVFDEPAYARPLNPYFQGARFRRPAGYSNSGSGSTWSFSHGSPSSQDRINVQVPQFRSPGDVATRQRNWPSPTPGISAYDDVGTSYLLNMRWWDDPSLSGLSFSARYIEGARRIGLALNGGNPSFVLMTDQTGGLVPNGVQMTGEFGKTNYSAVGWADGRADYIRIVPNAVSGPGYTFIP